MANKPQVILALDVGEKRIGVARGVASIGLASPLTTLINDDTITTRLADLCQQEQAELLVIGRPRNSQGQTTQQTAYTEQFVATLQPQINLPVVWQDESLTSVKAEQELTDRGRPFAKAEVDALAATYILEDYFQTETTHV